MSKPSGRPPGTTGRAAVLSSAQVKHALRVSRAIVAAGWLAATLAGAAAGGATGGIIGALSQQAGLSDEESQVYAEGLRRGGAVVSARVNDADRARLQYQEWLDRVQPDCESSRDEVVKERSLYR